MDTDVTLEKLFYAAFILMGIAVVGAVVLFAGMLALPVALVVALVWGAKWYQNRPEKTSEIYSTVEQVRTQANFPDPHDFFEAFATRYEADTKRLGIPSAGYNTLKEIYTIAMKLYADEELHVAPSPLRGVIEGSVAAGQYRDHLIETAKKARDPAKTMQIFAETLSSAFVGFTSCLPELATIQNDVEDAHGTNGITVRLFDTMGDDVKQAVEYLIAPFFKAEVTELNLFAGLRKQLDKNLDDIDDSEVILPKEFKGTNVETVDSYLSFTPFIDLFLAKVQWKLPEQMRFEHQWIVAPQGAGKTQLIQYQLTRDIEEVVKGNASVVVMDSQGDLINLISGLKAIPMEKLCIIEPDPSYPIALNLFDLGKSRVETYDERVREMLDNNALDLLTQVFDTLLGTETTPKQTTLFRHSIRLCRAVPDATIHTLTEILNTDTIPYPEHVARLPKTSRDFFETLFVDKKQFGQTKQEVAWRLSLMLENSTFERMFSQSKSKIDLFAELNSSKVILINTDKSLLKDAGTELFGRFFIAMLLQASQERALIKRENRLPTYVYIDEAQDYLAHDTNVTTILDQARKMNIGMVLAHQRTAQMDGKVLDALTNVSIKCARAVNDSGAHVLARNMAATPELISKQPVGHFAIALRNNPAVSIRIPPYVMENMPRIGDGDMKVLKHKMREKYAVQYKPEQPIIITPAPPKEPATEFPQAQAPPPPPPGDSERPTKWPMVD